MKLLPAACSILLVAGCATTTAPVATTAPAAVAVVVPAATPLAQAATVNVAPASGSLVSGRLNAMAMGNGVHFTGELGGFTPGTTHGIHIHEKGDCSAADASSAGGHFNPTNEAHGGPVGVVRHAGDLPNITANAQGVARIDLHVPGVTLGGPAGTDIAGRAIVVHAQPDDYVSQPSGSSGARIACGVIVAQR